MRHCFLKLREAEVIFFSLPLRSKNLKQKKDKMLISISDSARFNCHRAWTPRLLR